MRTNDSVDRILRESYIFACEKKHPYYTPEHVLYVALNFYKVQYILSKCQSNINVVRAILDDYFKINMSPPKEEPYTTQGLSEVLQIADYQVRSVGRSYIEEGSLIYSLSSLGEDSFASYALYASGLDIENLLFILSQITEFNDAMEEEYEEEEEDFSPFGPSKSLVDQLTVNLTEKAREGKLDPLIGREKELERTIHILCRKTKNNPLHVGEPGVGKTAITMGLASLIISDKVPDMLKGFEVLSLQMSQMVAGTRYRGDFEERIQRFLDELVERKKVILFIDEIHTIIGAGNGGGGQMDASNILKPLLATGDILCIGATTYEEYEKYFTKEKALLRRFHKIDISEPSEEDTLRILDGLKPFYEAYHGVTYTNKALQTSIKLSQKYLRERFLPDKAIDLMDEAGALTHLSQKKRKYITEKDVEIVLSKMLKIPVDTFSSNDNMKLITLDEKLNGFIFGQEKAISEVSRIVKRAYVGLKKETSPMGSFLFVGPTGVGKTELANNLSKLLNRYFIRFDMSEYQEKHSLARLIGSPPGYVGHEEGGLLTDALRRNPYSVVLLDEVEKAHPDIYSVLLQVMDYGTLTDSMGRKADFRNAILIMTSNLGVSDIGKNLVGFGERKVSTEEALQGALKKFFKPEFRNRLDKVITFNPLSKESMKFIVKKELDSFRDFLMVKKIILNVEESALEYLSEVSYNIEFGARFVRRLVEEKVKDWFIESFLDNRLKEGSMISISYRGEGKDITFDIS